MSETNTEFLRNRLLACVHTDCHGTKREPLGELRQSEWSARFERLMRNRLLVGRFRYARMGDPAKSQYDNLGGMFKRLREYQDSGNTELLADVANLCLIEFECGTHPLKHFSAADDGEHVEPIDWAAA